MMNNLSSTIRVDILKDSLPIGIAGVNTSAITVGHDCDSLHVVNHKYPTLKTKWDIQCCTSTQ